jgi:DNA-directed RNA polymerase specialized sigma24 family protein
VALLSSRLQLFDLNDVEAMIWDVITSNGRLYLNPQQRESLATYLIEEVWRSSLRFDAAKGSFSTFAGIIARRRVVDWLRLEFGRTTWQFADRTIERPRPELVSFNGDEGDRLAETVTAGTGDPADAWNPDLERLLDGGDRQRARDHELLGLEPPRRAA